MKVLVTGSNGQMGQQFQALYSNNGWEWTWADRTFLDITNFEKCEQILSKDYDFCINLAAYTAVDKAEEESKLSEQINSLGPENLAKVCLKNNIQLIHFSTDYVYDNQTVPYSEEDALLCQGVYANSKRQGEILIQKANPNAIILRTSWIYSQYGHNFYKTIKRFGDNKTDMRIVNDQIGVPTFAGDICETVVKLIKIKSKDLDNQQYKGIFNFSNGGSCSWYDFANEIVLQLQSEITITPIPSTGYPTPAPRPKYSVMNLDKIQATFGVKINPWKKAFNTFWLNHSY